VKRCYKDDDIRKTGSWLSAPGDLLLAEMAEAVPPGHVALWWLGQSGFAFAFHWRTRVLYIDLYLSDQLSRTGSHPLGYLCR